MKKEGAIQEVENRVVKDSNNPVVPAAPVQTVSKKTVWFLVSIIVLLGIALTYLSYLFLGNNKEVVKDNPVENKATTIETSESEGIKEDPTKDWKTYTNEKLGYSFKYPETDLEVIDCPRGSVDTTFIVPSEEKRHFDPCASSGGSFTITKHAKNYKLPSYYYVDYDVKSTSGFLVGTVSSVKYSGTRSNNEPAPIPDSVDLILVPQLESTLQISLGKWTGETSLESKYFEQILSTFRFINADETSDFEAFDVVIRNLFSDVDVSKQSVSRYTFKYPTKDVSSVDMLSDGSSNVSGISIKLNNGVDLNIKPAFEGSSVSYNAVDGKPNVKKISNPNFVEEIFRILGVSNYSYVTGYGEGANGCSHWDPLPLACHMSNAGFNKIGGYEITCNTKDISKVKLCDGIVENLAISVEELK